MLRIIKILILVFVIVSALAMHLRNDQLVTFDYYLGGVELPFSVFIVASICIGAVLGVLALVPALIRLERDKSRLASKIQLSEKELEALRVIPVKE